MWLSWSCLLGFFVGTGAHSRGGAWTRTRWTGTPRCVAGVRSRRRWWSSTMGHTTGSRMASTAWPALSRPASPTSPPRSGRGRSGTRSSTPSAPTPTTAWPCRRETASAPPSASSSMRSGPSSPAAPSPSTSASDPRPASPTSGTGSGGRGTSGPSPRSRAPMGRPTPSPSPNRRLRPAEKGPGKTTARAVKRLWCWTRPSTRSRRGA